MRRQGGSREDVSEVTERGSGIEDFTGHGAVPDWHALDSVDDIVAVQLDALGKTGRPQMLAITMDSGAAGVVAPPTFAPGYAVRKSQVQDGEREHHGQPW